MKDIKNKTGIYIAHPTSKELKPIYTGYQTKVNNQHTKIGKVKNSFDERKKNYLSTFNGEVVFEPLVIISDVTKLDMIEKYVCSKISLEFSKVGKSKEWFDTNNHEQIKKIVKHSLVKFKGLYEYVA